MPGGKIAVQPQLVGADPVVHDNCSGTIVVFLNGLWLFDLKDDPVRQCPAGLVQLAKALALDHLPVA